MFAHKVLCMRCTYFRAMLTGEMKESRAKTITLPDVRRPIFLALLEYLYTDEVRTLFTSFTRMFLALLEQPFTPPTRHASYEHKNENVPCGEYLVLFVSFLGGEKLSVGTK